MNKIIKNTRSNEFTQIFENNKSLFKDLPEINKKKIKVTSNNFVIPTYCESENILKFNYNVAQLKKICKHYKLKIGGNKTVLQKRIYNYLVLSLGVIKMQSLYRGYLVRLLCHLRGPALKHRSLCLNDSDFISLDDIKEVSFYQFFSLSSIDNRNKHVYGFDLCSIYNLLVKNKTKSENPYNRQPITPETMRDLKKILRISHILNHKVNVIVENEVETLSDSSQLSVRITTLFQKMDELGNYTNSTWFSDLSRPLIIRFIRELFDIWNHRLGIDIVTKRLIVQPSGTPFRDCNFNFHTFHTKTFDQIQLLALNIMEKFVNCGLTEEHKKIGTYYVLMALTLVNNDAAIALPALYESVSNT